MTITCDACGFDGARWSDDDIERTLAHADDLIGYVLEGAAPDVRAAIHDAVPPPAVGDDDALVTVHALMHHLDELAAERRSREVFEPMIGRVASLHASAGGVPKRSIDRADVDAGGIVGDAQNNRRNHGRPWQALCTYSSDQLEALRDEGHPIDPGGAGENLLVSGIDWSRMRGGLTIEIGGRVRLRTSGPAAPCHKIGDCFTDRHWDRIHHDERPGWARWYASVLVAGAIEPGDAVIVTA
jgi:MOSC domain-containing protein YiiM